MIEASMNDLRAVFGFGVAGNFAGHLDQAGEAADFVKVKADAGAPKGIFPWYVPADAGAIVPEFLRGFPVSSDTIAMPQGGADLQIEPEVGLLAEVGYDSAGKVTALKPVAVGAFNDCSIRRPGANKISEKKHWGPASKGYAAKLFEIDDLAGDGPTKNFRLACFMVRDGSAHAYGQDSAVPEYSYYGAQLIDWTIERLNNQLGSDDTPLENVGAYLTAAGNPARVLIGIGATRYTDYGESTYLQLGDDSVVVVYDSSVHSPAQVAAAVADGSDLQLQAASVLRQRVKTL
jgi:Family of unknown function (DUF5718)